MARSGLYRDMVELQRMEGGRLTGFRHRQRGQSSRLLADAGDRPVEVQSGVMEPASLTALALWVADLLIRSGSRFA
jgi:hypothetical protein